MRSKTELRDNFSSDPHSTQRILATSAAGGGITGRHTDTGGTGSAPARALGLVESTHGRAGRDRAPARALDWWKPRQGRDGSGPARTGTGGEHTGKGGTGSGSGSGTGTVASTPARRDGIGLRLGTGTVRAQPARAGRDRAPLRALGTGGEHTGKGGTGSGSGRHWDCGEHDRKAGRDRAPARALGLVASTPARAGRTGSGLGTGTGRQQPTVTSGMLRKIQNSDECPSCVTS